MDMLIKINSAKSFFPIILNFNVGKRASVSGRKTTRCSQRMGEIQLAYMNKRRPFKPIIYFIALVIILTLKSNLQKNIYKIHHCVNQIS